LERKLKQKEEDIILYAMKKIFLILLSAVSLSFPGCNVWEDRGSCPKILSIDCKQLEGKALNADIWVFNSDSSLLAGSRITEHEFHTLQNFQVMEGSYLCRVWANIGEGTVTTDISSLSGRLYKVASKDADPLFSFAAEVYCSKDTTVVRVVPKKMFIDVYVSLEGLKSTDVASVEIFSSYGGFSLDGKCLKQENTVNAEGTGIIHLRITRPESLEGLRLAISARSGSSSTDYPDLELGRYLEQNNYDLLSNDLKDIYITLDLTKIKTVIGTDPLDYLPPVEIRY